MLNNPSKIAAQAVLNQLHELESARLDDAGPDEPMLTAQLRSRAVQKALKETLGIDDGKLTQLVLAAVPRWDPVEVWDATHRDKLAKIILQTAKA